MWRASRSLVTDIYANLFDRDVSSQVTTTTGAGYWVQQILHNTLSIGDAVIAIINGAQGADQTVLSNKLEVATYFEAQAQAAGLTQTPPTEVLLEEAHAVIKYIDATTESVNEAEAAINAFVGLGNLGTVFTGPGNTLTFTPSQDTLQGFGHDIFNAPLAGVVGAQSATLQSGDSAIDMSPDTNNVLNATFNPTDGGTETFGFFHFFGEYEQHRRRGSGGFFFAKTTTIDGPNYVNATIEGIGTWNLTGTGDVYGYGPYVAINGGPNVDPTTVNMINSSVETWFDIGTGGNNFQPLGYGNSAQGLVTTIGASNDAGGDRY